MMLTRALSALRPGIEFTFNDEDLSTIKWSVEGTATPTQAEVNAKIVELETIDATKILTKKSALAKLEALGLTSEEIASL